jgi:hypothetical protein
MFHKIFHTNNGTKQSTVKTIHKKFLIKFGKNLYFGSRSHDETMCIPLTVIQKNEIPNFYEYHSLLYTCLFAYSQIDVIMTVQTVQKLEFLPTFHQK